MREFRSALPSLLHKRGIDIIPVTLEVVYMTRAMLNLMYWVMEANLNDYMNLEILVHVSTCSYSFVTIWNNVQMEEHSNIVAVLLIYIFY